MKYRLSKTESNLLHFADYLCLRYSITTRTYHIRVSCWPASMPGVYTVRTFKSWDDAVQFGRWCPNHTGLAFNIL